MSAKRLFLSLLLSSVTVTAGQNNTAVYREEIPGANELLTAFIQKKGGPTALTTGEFIDSQYSNLTNRQSKLGRTNRNKFRTIGQKRLVANLIEGLMAADLLETAQEALDYYALSNKDAAYYKLEKKLAQAQTKESVKKRRRATSQKPTAQTVLEQNRTIRRSTTMVKEPRVKETVMSAPPLSQEEQARIDATARYEQGEKAFESEVASQAAREGQRRMAQQEFEQEFEQGLEHEVPLLKDETTREIIKPAELPYPSYIAPTSRDLFKEEELLESQMPLIPTKEMHTIPHRESSQRAVSPDVYRSIEAGTLTPAVKLEQEEPWLEELEERETLIPLKLAPSRETHKLLESQELTPAAQEEQKEEASLPTTARSRFGNKTATEFVAQQQAAAPSEPRDVVYATEEERQNRDPLGIWSLLSLAIEKGEIRFIMDNVPAIVSREARRNAPGLPSNGKTIGEIAAFNIGETRKKLEPSNIKAKQIFQAQQIIHAYVSPDQDKAKFEKIYKNYMNETWSWLAQYIENGDLPMVQFLVPNIIRRADRRPAFGNPKPSDNLTPYQIADYNAKQTIDKFKKEKDPELLEIQRTIAEYLKTTAEKEANLTTVASHAITFALLQKNSDYFQKTVCLLPTLHNRIEIMAGNNQSKQNRIAEQARTVRPILHTKTVDLIDAFLTYKIKHGSAIERSFYQGMTIIQFVDRLLVKRPLEFMTASDSYKLRDGTRGYGIKKMNNGSTTNDFADIGTNRQQPPLILTDYISYDEMQIAALLGVSVPTYFINDGDRYNVGTPNFKGKPYQEEGVYVGSVGARFEVPGYMEWAHMMITKKQNTAGNGYGTEPIDGPKTELLKIWAGFYGIDYFPSWQEAAQAFAQEEEQAKAAADAGLQAPARRFVKAWDGASWDGFFDLLVYKKRMQMVIEPFLADANQRAKDQNRSAHCRVVGLGLGVWAKDSVQQTKAMLVAYKEVMERNAFDNIAGVDFTYFGKSTADAALTAGQKIRNTTIYMTNTNPAAPLQDPNQLLVAMYAWDGGSYPGNEYWIGSLSASGDPAAACCSTIPELQNPLINPAVSGKNMFTAGLTSLEEAKAAKATSVGE